MAKIRVYSDETDGDYFPKRCVRCGVETGETTTNTFSWRPSWVGILILAGLLPWLIVSSILRKSMRITLPVCRRHRNHWRNRRTYVWLGLLFWVVYAIGLVVAGQELSKDAMFAGLAVLMFGGLLWLLVGVFYTNSGIRPREITDRWAELIKVDKQFAEEWLALNPPPAPRPRTRRRAAEPREEEY